MINQGTSSKSMVRDGSGRLVKNNKEGKEFQKGCVRKTSKPRFSNEQSSEYILKP